MVNEVEVKAEKIYKRDIYVKIVKISFLLLLILLSIIYLIVYVVYDGGRFTISLDKNLTKRRNLYLSEDGNSTKYIKQLSAETLKYMDNISGKWIPENIDNEGVGAHNGNNYIAYTFYIVNGGNEVVNYWYELDIDDTILNVDEAIRIMIFQNGERQIYAKKSKIDGSAEEGTKKFYSESIAVLEQKKNFKPNQKDKYTIVVWIDGDDPECQNDLLGGEIKMHMSFTEEHVDKKNKK